MQRVQLLRHAKLTWKAALSSTSTMRSRGPRAVLFQVLKPERLITLWGFGDAWCESELVRFVDIVGLVANATETMHPCCKLSKAPSIMHAERSS